MSKDFNSINKIQKSVSNTLKTSSSIIEPMDLEEVEFLILNDHHKLQSHLKNLKNNPGMYSPRTLNSIEFSGIKNIYSAQKAQKSEIGLLASPRNKLSRFNSLEGMISVNPKIFFKYILIHLMDQIPFVDGFVDIKENQKKPTKYQDLMTMFQKN